MTIDSTTDAGHAMAIAVDCSNAIICLANNILELVPDYEVMSFTNAILAVAEKVEREVGQAQEGTAA